VRDGSVPVLAAPPDRAEVPRADQLPLVTVESLTTTLEPIILPKLQWWKWTGVDRPGGDEGTGAGSRSRA
jgi:hypothetical protein